MFGKNLTYYRLKSGMSKKDLAARVGVSAMAITNYECGSRKPDMKTMKALALALGVRVSDFLTTRNEHLTFVHGEFRRNSSLTKSQQDYISASVEEYFGRFMTVVDVLGEKVLPDFPACHKLQLQSTPEQSASLLRQHLGFAVDGPIEDLVGKMENKGILICFMDLKDRQFSGRNGFVDGRPYIVLNKSMSPERNRSTLVHELAHLMFFWPEEVAEKDAEKMATAISGAFLFPESDAVRELGVRRREISRDMENVAREYGISMMLLTKRAQLCRIVTEDAAKAFYIAAGQVGWRINEPSRIPVESPRLFEQLVYRAVTEEEISLQRGAELLGISYNEIAGQCYFNKE